MIDERLLKLLEKQEEINICMLELAKLINAKVDAFDDKINNLAYEIHKLNWDVIELENKLQEIKKKLE
jgi:uncharacterized protein YaaR (DUF327 family)